MLLTVACVGGPHSQTFVLSAATTISAPATKDPATAVLQVEVAALPAYLDNTDILLRRGAHRLESAPLGHWGERLSLGVTHALADDLSDRLPLDRVVLQRPEVPSARLLRVNVDAFDVFPDGHCVLVANWAIVDKSRASPPVLGQGTFVTPPLAVVKPDVAALVAAMSAAVAGLAEGVVSTL
jgi:uncharacterized lipoprotein YmbA